MTDEHASDSLLELDEVNQLREQLETERRAFEASREVWKLERDRQEQQLLERASELQLLEQEVELQRHLLDHERQTWEQRTADLAPQMDESASDEHDASSRSENDSASPLASSSQAQSDTAPLDTVPSDAGEGTDYDPIAALEQLRRMVETEKEEDEPRDEAIQPIAPAHQSAAPATHVPDNVSNDDEHEESIDDYMNKLMSRVNGESEQIGPEPTTPVQPMDDSAATKPTTPPSTNQAVQRDPASLDDGAAPPDSQKMTPRVRRSARPELSTHLATMREVANTSSRTAIDTSARRERNRRRVRNAAMVAGIYVVSGYAIFGLSNLLKITALLAVCVGGAALLWKYRNFAPIAYAIDWTKRQSLRWRKSTPQDKATKQNDTESNEPSDAAGSPEPTSENSTEEAADDNSRIDSH